MIVRRPDRTLFQTARLLLDYKHNVATLADRQKSRLRSLAPSRRQYTHTAPRRRLSCWSGFVYRGNTIREKRAKLKKWRASAKIFRNMPMGMYTVLSEDAGEGTLSGGQRQPSLITWAILSKPNIILLTKPPARWVTLAKRRTPQAGEISRQLASRCLIDQTPLFKPPGSVWSIAENRFRKEPILNPSISPPLLLSLPGDHSF